MNTAIETITGSLTGADCLVEPANSELRQNRYSVSTLSCTDSSPSKTSTLTPSELEAIRDEVKDMILNDWEPDHELDDDDIPEDGSLIIHDTDLTEANDFASHPKKGNFYADDTHSLSSFNSPVHWTANDDSLKDKTTAKLNTIFVNGGAGIDELAKSAGLTYSASMGAGQGMERQVHQKCLDQAPRTSCTISSPSVQGQAPIILTLQHNYEIEEEVVRDAVKLNRSDLSEIERHAHLLSVQEQSHLKLIKNKVVCWPSRFPDSDQYKRQSQLLLLANGWTSAKRYAHCSIPNSNHNGVCRLHKFCPHCSWWEGNKQSLTYVPAYGDGNWFFLTGSFTGSLEMTSPAQASDWLLYWNAYKSALHTLVEAGDLRGVFWTEELAVISMLPMKVLPHIHCIIEADAIDEQIKDKLNHLVALHLHLGLEEPLKPNLRVAPITTDRSLYFHIRYMIKPIKLVKAYDLAWSRAAVNNRQSVQQLNSQATDLVLGYTHVTTDRCKLNTKGNLKPSTKNFIGVREKHHDDYTELFRDITEGPHEYIELEEGE